MPRACIGILAVLVAGCGLFHKNKPIVTLDNSNEVKEIYYQGESQYNLGNLSEAESSFQKFVKASSRPASGYYRLACIKKQETQYEEALAFNAKAKLLDTANAYFYLLLDAEILRSQREYIGAGDIYASLAHAKKNRWSLYLDAARMFQAASHTDKILGLCKNWELDFGIREEIVHSRNWAYSRKGMPDSIVLEFQKLVKKYPERRQYKLQYAKALQTAGQDEKAAAIFTELLVSDPENGDLLANLCQYYQSNLNRQAQWEVVKKMAASQQTNFEDKQFCIQAFLSPESNMYFDSMEPLLRNIIKIHTTDSRAWYLLATWQQDQHLYKNAAASYSKSVNLYSNYEAWRKYSYCLERLKQYKKMNKVVDSMLEFFPSNPEVYGFSALATAGLELWSKAIELCETGKSYAVETESKHNLQIILARILNLSGNKEKSYRILNQLVSENSKDHNALFELTRAALHNGTVSIQTLEFINKAIQYHPNYGDYLDARGMVYLQLKRTEEAIMDFKTAVSLDGGFADYWEHLGDAYTTQRIMDEAKKCYGKALELLPDSERLKVKINKI